MHAVISAGAAGLLLFSLLILLALGVAIMVPLIAVPLALIVLVTLCVGVIALLSTPTGRWTLAAIVLTVVPLLGIGMFRTYEVTVVEHQEARQQSMLAHDHRQEDEVINSIPVESVPSAIPPAVPSPSEIPSATDTSSDSALTQPVRFVERVYDPKLGYMKETDGAEQPDWLKNGTYQTGSSERGQLTSERFATTEEARTQLLAQLLPRVQNQLKMREPRVGRWEPTLEQLEVAGIVEREAIATYQLSVGEFKEPVHEVSWAYNLNNEAAMQKVHRDWQRHATADRIPRVVAALLGMAVIFAIASGLIYRSGATTEVAQRKPAPQA